MRRVTATGQPRRPACVARSDPSRTSDQMSPTLGSSRSVLAGYPKCGIDRTTGVMVHSKCRVRSRKVDASNRRNVESQQVRLVRRLLIQLRTAVCSRFPDQLRRHHQPCGCSAPSALASFDVQTRRGLLRKICGAGFAAKEQDMNPCELLVGLGKRLALPPLLNLAWALVVDDGMALSLRQNCRLFGIASCDAPQAAARDVGC